MSEILSVIEKAVSTKKILGKTKEKSFMERTVLLEMIAERIKNELANALESGLNDIFLGIDNAISEYFDPIDETTKTAEEMGGTAFGQQDIQAVTKAMHEIKIKERSILSKNLVHIRDKYGMFHGLFPDGTSDNVLQRGYNRAMNMLFGD